MPITIGFDASRAFQSEKTGTETYSAQLLKALAAIDRKNHYRVYIRSANETQLPANFKLAEIRQPRFWTQVGLAWEVLRNPPDVLFIPAHTLPALPVFLRGSTPKRLRLKTVVTIHDLGAEFLPQYHLWPQKLYLTASTRFAVKFASHLIAVSAATKKELVSRYKANPKKITVIYEGVNHKKFTVHSLRPELRPRGSRFTKPYILFVGTVQPRKNLERLIQAFSLLVHGSQLSLLIVGKKGWLADEIYAAPKKFGVEGQVHFLGYVAEDDLPRIYQGAAVFVLPSLVEGFGLPVLESMACGTPVVVSKISSLPEVAGEAAVYIDPNSVESITAGIKKVLTLSKVDYEDLRKKSITQAAKFSWEKTARETLRVLEMVAKK